MNRPIDGKRSTFFVCSKQTSILKSRNGMLIIVIAPSYDNDNSKVCIRPAWGSRRNHYTHYLQNMMCFCSSLYNNQNQTHIDFIPQIVDCWLLWICERAKPYAFEWGTISDSIIEFSNSVEKPQMNQSAFIHMIDYLLISIQCQWPA